MKTFQGRVVTPGCAQAEALVTQILWFRKRIFSERTGNLCKHRILFRIWKQCKNCI